MRKELSINIDSVLTSYSYYAFPQCIITSEERVGNLIAEFTILDSEKSEWNRKGYIKNGDNDATWIVISEDKYRRECNGCLYRKIEDKDYIHIQVEKQQYTKAWAAVNLLISDNEENVLLGDEEYLCRFGHFQYNGVNLLCSGEWQDINTMQLEPPYRLALRREGNRIEVYAGENQAKLVGVREIEFPTDQDLYIGIQVKHGNNSVIPWFFSNFIQLSCDVADSDRKLEFHYGLVKHWEYNLFHYFLDTNRIEAEMALKLGGVKFIKDSINKGKYIEAKLDQYYITESEEYKVYHYLHQNLIYGYDDKQKIFLIVGYDDFGRLIKTKIRYADFLKSMNRDTFELVNIISYSQDTHQYAFDPQYVKMMIEQYLNGTNSGEMLQNIVPKLQRRYGMKIYEELISEQGVVTLVSDRRMAHVLWEHKVCMARRIEYLTRVGIFDEKDGEWLQGKMNQIADDVFNLKNILLKYQMRPDKQNNSLIFERLNKIREDESICLHEVLEKWNEINERDNI